MSMFPLLRRFVWRMRGYLSVEDLKRRGLKVGKNCKIMEHVLIDASHCWHITIGDNVTIAPRAYLLAHDTSPYHHLGYTAIGKIKIEDGVFIGANAIILPNVTIGKNSIIGAGSVVAQDIPENVVAVGNPARVICSLEVFLTKHKKHMKSGPLFGEEYTLRQGVTRAMMDEMNRRMKNGYGYIK